MFGPKPEVLGSNTTCLGTQNLLDFADPPKKNTRFYILNPLDLYKGLEWFRPQGITRYHKCMMDYDGMYIYTILYHTCFITSASTKGQSSLVVSNDSY